MSINMFCKNRIKPKLLREQKTEALLVFIRTTLEQYFQDIEQNSINLTIGTIENTQYIHNILKTLLENLQECVVNSTYLRSLLQNSQKDYSLQMILKKEEPLMVYYDSIVKGIGTYLPYGSKWIPELMVLSLLSEWILEEQRSVYLYPFLKDIDYIHLIEKYDVAKLSSEEEEKEIIMNMYLLSTKLIKNLKNTTYKINPTRKKRFNR